MATLEQVENLLKDVHDRLAAQPKPLDEAAIKTLVDQVLAAAIADENSEFYRKMRFGQPSAKLQGSKFARWNLSVSDIEFLHDIQVSLTGQRRVDGSGFYRGPSEELANCWKDVTDSFYIGAEQVKSIDQRAMDDLFPRIPKHWFSSDDKALAEKGFWFKTEAYQRAQKAMDSAESGYGLQLVGAQYVRDLWDAARAESRVFARIQSFEMTDPTAYLPVEADIPELLFVSESTANNSSNYTTVKTGSQRVQVDAKKFVIHQMWSGEMEEDSIIPFIPFLRRQLALSLAHYSDSLVLNGDTTNAGTGNINLDDADPADTKHYLAFDGIRHVGLVDVTGNSKDAAGAVTYSLLTNQRGRMIDTTRLFDWGHPTDPMDLIYVSDPETGDQISLLDEVITVDKMGAQATVITGQQGKIGSHPLITSMAMSKTEADGKVSTTASNNTKGQVVAFNSRGFNWGWRRRVRIETERLPATDQTRLVASLRAGFGRYSPTGAASGIESADCLYNITLP